MVVTIDGGYTYRSTVGVMGGQFLVPLSEAHRTAAGIAAGDTVEVTLEVDTLPRTVELPSDLAAAFDEAGVRAAYETLSASRQRALVDPVLAAKARRRASAGSTRPWSRCVRRRGGSTPPQPPSSTRTRGISARSSLAR